MKAEMKIPKSVAAAAARGLKLRRSGYKGGTRTGWMRGRQLVTRSMIDTRSLADMRTWFARHGPDASNGGTSYNGYLKWKRDGMPMHGTNKLAYRGAVAWLLWGGDAAYTWLKTAAVRTAMKAAFPGRKAASRANNLQKA